MTREGKPPDARVVRGDIAEARRIDHRRPRRICDVIAARAMTGLAADITNLLSAQI
jgi:hypothetical protein